MAVVYLARETKHERQVAIKVLHADVGAAFGAERFKREIGIAARLSHPHIVPLYDSGEADGLLYYISAFVPGGSLRDRLANESKLSPSDAIRIAEEVGAGLDFAHRTGFVHRDVKPENILFADGHALLADFGIARAVDNAGAPDAPAGRRPTSVTEPGIAVGTPEYMSPEQAAGEQHVDSRSDIYSLACVLFEMLTGEAPFTGTSPMQVMAKQVTEKPRRLRALRPDVPTGLDDAVNRALEKDPARRFKTITEFTTALSVADAPQRRVRATRGIVVLPFVNASPDPENEYLSDGITDELINALAKLRGIRVASRTSVFALKGKPQDVRAIGALLDAAYVLEGTVRRSGSRLRITAQLSSTDDGGLLWSQRYDRKLDDVFAIEDEIAETIVNTLRAGSLADPATPAIERHTTNVRAYSLYLKGRYEWNLRTDEGVANGIKFFEQAIAEDPTYALAYTGLADSYALHVDYRNVRVQSGFEHAKMYARRAIELDDSLAEAHASLAWSLFIYDWDWQAADAEFRRAISCDPRYAPAHQWYQFLLAAKGSLDQALVEGLTAVDLDPASVSVLRSLGFSFIYSRRYAQARPYLERAVAMNPLAEESYRLLGLTFALEGDFAEAERVIREVTNLPQATYPYATLGYVLGRAGRTDEARAILAELEEQRARDYVSPVALATIELGLGNVERALDWTEAAYEERRGFLAYLKVNPLIDPMRGHPRFEALITRMNL